MIQISVIGGLLDIPQQDISSTFASLRFSDAIPEQFTTDIELPRTPHNTRLLGAYGELDRGQLFGAKIPCYIATEKRNSVGCLTVDRLTEMTITITVYFGNFPVELMDTKIRDLVSDNKDTIVEMVDYDDTPPDTSALNVGRYKFYTSYYATTLSSGQATRLPPFNTYGYPLMPAVRVNYLLQRIGTAIGYTMPIIDDEIYLVARELVGSRNVPAVSTFGVTQQNLDSDVLKECAQTGIELGKTQNYITLRTDQDCRVHVKIGGEITQALPHSVPPYDIIDFQSQNAGVSGGHIEPGHPIGVDWEFDATANTTYKWLVVPNGTVLLAKVTIWACTLDQMPTDSDDHEAIDISLLGRYVDSDGDYTQYLLDAGIADCYIGAIACLGDYSVKEFLTALCWQTGQHIISDCKGLTFEPATREKTVKHATLTAFEPIFDKLGRVNILARPDGQKKTFGLDNSLLADEVTVQDVPLWSLGIKKKVGVQVVQRLVTKILEWEYDAENTQWKPKMGDFDGMVIGKLNTTAGANQWWLQPLDMPDWLGIDHLKKCALTTWQTYESVEGCDYVWIAGHQYMIVDGTTDEDSGVCEFRALEITDVVITGRRDFSDDFSDDFS